MTRHERAIRNRTASAQGTGSTLAIPRQSQTRNPLGVVDLCDAERVVAVLGEGRVVDVGTVIAERLVVNLEAAEGTMKAVAEEDVVDQRRGATVKAGMTEGFVDALGARVQPVLAGLVETANEAHRQRVHRVVEVAHDADRVIGRVGEDPVDEPTYEQSLRGALDETPDGRFTERVGGRGRDLRALGRPQQRGEVRLEVGGEDVDLSERARLEAHVDDTAPERDAVGERVRITFDEFRKRQGRRSMNLRPLNGKARQDGVADPASVFGSQNGCAIAELGNLREQPVEELRRADLLKRDDVGASAPQAGRDVRHLCDDHRVLLGSPRREEVFEVEGG